MDGLLADFRIPHPGADHEVIRKVNELAIRLARRAPEADRTRRLPQETVNELRNEGLLTLYIDATDGGLEATYPTQMQVTELVAAACASTAWCLINHSATVLMARSILGESARPYLEAVVHDGAILAHAQAPSGKAVPVPGGFVANGRWPFVSFSNYAKWTFLSTMVDGPPPGWQPAGKTSTPPPTHNRWLWLAMDEPGIVIEDTWDAMSLRATMSNDIVLEDVFIPEERAPVVVRPQPETVWVPNPPPAFRIPYSTIRALIGGQLLGIAQAALNDTIEYAENQNMTVGGNAKVNMPGNQFAVADAAIAIDSARTYLYDKVRYFAEKAITDEPFTRDDAIQLQMANLMARENSQIAVDRLFAIRGAHGLHVSGNFERYYRDVRAGTLHAFFPPDLERELIGKHLFGVPADTQPRWA